MITILASKIRVFVLAAVLGMALGLMSPVHAKWYIADLNTKEIIPIGPPNGNISEVTAINDTGQVVGYFSTPGGDNHAFITGPNGAGMTDLGTLGGRESIASGINDAGHVVGRSNGAGSDRWTYPFITGPNGVGMTRLGTLGGGNNVLDYAAGINASAQVVGQSALPTLEGHAFITGPNGVGMSDLGTIGGSFSSASDVNDAGRVVGNSTMQTFESWTHAFITGPNGVGMTDLGTLGGLSSTAYGINETGRVVGVSNTPSGEQHAFITGPNGVGMTDLGALGGWFSFASGINDAGRVVGIYSVADGGPLNNHAFITGPEGAGMTDLNSLINPPSGFTWENALGINNHDQVIVIATSIREPETYALMLAGIVLVGIMALRNSPTVS